MQIVQIASTGIGRCPETVTPRLAAILTAHANSLRSELVYYRSAGYSIVDGIDLKEPEECGICYEEPDQAVHCTRCNAPSCLECLKSHLRLGSNLKCPYCSLDYVDVKKTWGKVTLEPLAYDCAHGTNQIWNHGEIPPTRVSAPGTGL